MYSKNLGLELTWIKGPIGSDPLCSFSVPHGDQGQNKTGKTKCLHMELLKTGVLHREMCVQSLWETVKYRNKGKNKRLLHKDAFLRMCVWSVYTRNLCQNYPGMSPADTRTQVNNPLNKKGHAPRDPEQVNSDPGMFRVCVLFILVIAQF